MPWLFVFLLIILFPIYKLLDRLIRIPRLDNVSNRYILITGCDTGFGNRLARRLDHLGCHVFAGCIGEAGEMELKRVCTQRLHPLSLDVTKKESAEKALDYVKAKLPPGRGLWGVLNNVEDKPLCCPPDWLTVEDMKRTSDVNLWGLVEISLTFLPLVKLERGRVINFSSFAGRTVPPLLTPYSISKYGVEAFTDGLRRCLNCFGCKVILIEPGGFRTGISVENVLQGLSCAWDSSSTEVKDEYGRDYMEHLTKKTIPQQLATYSSRTDDVIAACEHALMSRFPRARYVIGNDVKFFYLPLQLLPECMSDWVYRQLDDDLPAPAAVRHHQHLS